MRLVGVLNDKLAPSRGVQCQLRLASKLLRQACAKLLKEKVKDLAYLRCENSDRLCLDCMDDTSDRPACTPMKRSSTVATRRAKRHGVR